jgi:hypothetical protein
VEDLRGPGDADVDEEADGSEGHDHPQDLLPEQLEVVPDADDVRRPEAEDGHRERAVDDAPRLVAHPDLDAPE